MPKEIHMEDELRKILEKASECRVVRRGDKVKIKLRTAKVLYTYVAKRDEADRLLKDIKVSTIEI